MIIAVDYDGVLSLDGKPNRRLIDMLRHEQSRGAVVILWTCRYGRSLVEAVRQLNKWGFRPNHVNANCPEVIGRFGCDTRKVYADVYIDDKNARMR